MEAVCRNTNAVSVLRKLFSGDFDFRKTETNFSKRIFGIGFLPAGGVWGGMRGGFFFGFLAGRQRKKPFQNFGMALVD
jgi:hypothetical protein